MFKNFDFTCGISNKVRLKRLQTKKNLSAMLKGELCGVLIPFKL